MSKSFSPGDEIAPAPGRASEVAAGLRDPASVLLAVCGVSLALLLASVLQDVMLYAGPHPDLSAKIWLLDVDTEASVFTWISIVSLFSAAWLLFAAGRDAAARGDRFRWHWHVLAALFLLVSFDEFSGIHEKLSAALAGRFANTGLLYFAWAAPAGIISLAGLAAFVPFLRSLPPMVGATMIASAALFLGGAVGVEMLGGSVAEAAGIESLRYRLLANLEEGLELAGTLLFIHALMLEAAGRNKPVMNRR